jgi:hypothetical protein
VAASWSARSPVTKERRGLAGGQCGGRPRLKEIKGRGARSIAPARVGGVGVAGVPAVTQVGLVLVEDAGLPTSAVVLARRPVS